MLDNPSHGGGSSLGLSQVEQKVRGEEGMRKRFRTAGLSVAVMAVLALAGCSNSPDASSTEVSSSTSPSTSVAPEPSTTVAEPTTTAASAGGSTTTVVPSTTASRSTTTARATTTTAAPAPTAPLFRVKTVTAVSQYPDGCSTNAESHTFTATLSFRAGHPSGEVTYHWERSDSATGPNQTVAVAAGELSKTVSTTWYLGGPSLPDGNYWEKLVVTSPNSISSGQATIHLYATACFVN